jgi:hypothetical protein
VTRRQVRWLTVHAAVVGIAWFAVGLPVAAQALGGLLAAVLGVLALRTGRVDADPFLRWAWLVPALIATAHAATAGALRPQR